MSNQNGDQNERAMMGNGWIPLGFSLIAMAISIATIYIQHRDLANSTRPILTVEHGKFGNGEYGLFIKNSGFAAAKLKSNNVTYANKKYDSLSEEVIGQISRAEFGNNMLPFSISCDPLRSGSMISSGQQSALFVAQVHGSDNITAFEKALKNIKVSITYSSSLSKVYTLETSSIE